VTLAYGVTEFQVSRITVGHYGCGGIQAAIPDKPDNLGGAEEAVSSPDP
jgi:carbonic anhydrase